MGQKKDGVSYTTIGFYAGELAAIARVTDALGVSLASAVRLMVRAASGEEHARVMLAPLFPGPDATPFTAEGD